MKSKNIKRFTTCCLSYSTFDNCLNYQTIEHFMKNKLPNGAKVVIKRNQFEEEDPQNYDFTIYIDLPNNKKEVTDKYWRIPTIKKCFKISFKYLEKDPVYCAAENLSKCLAKLDKEKVREYIDKVEELKYFTPKSWSCLKLSNKPYVNLMKKLVFVADNFILDNNGLEIVRKEWCNFGTDYQPLEEWEPDFYKLESERDMYNLYIEYYTSNELGLQDLICGVLQEMNLPDELNQIITWEDEPEDLRELRVMCINYFLDDFKNKLEETEEVWEIVEDKDEWRKFRKNSYNKLCFTWYHYTLNWYIENIKSETEIPYLFTYKNLFKNNYLKFVKDRFLLCESCHTNLY